MFCITYLAVLFLVRLKTTLEFFKLFQDPFLLLAVIFHFSNSIITLISSFVGDSSLFMCLCMACGQAAKLVMFITVHFWHWQVLFAPLVKPVGQFK